MPPVVVYIAAEAAIAATAVGATAVVAAEVAAIAEFVVTWVATAAVLFGAQKLLGSFKKTNQLTAVSQQLVKNNLAPRTIIYGRVQLGGSLFYVQQSGSGNGDLYLGVVYSGRQCSGIDQYNLNNFALSLDGSGNFTGETNLNSGVTSTNFAGKGAVWTLDSTGNPHFGSQVQTVDPLLQAAATSGVWPNTARLGGCCYVVYHLVYDQKVFAGGIPSPSAIIRGKPIIDPRTAALPTGTISSGSPSLTVSSTSGITSGMTVVGPGIPMNTTISAIVGLVLTLSANATLPSTGAVFLVGTPAYSNNSVLCVMDYMMDQTYGFKSQPGDFNLAALVASLNNCDEAVPLAGGGTEPRYTLNTVIDTSQTPGSILQNLLTSCAGSVVWAGGQWYLYSGYYRAPSVTLSESDFRDTPVIPTMPSRRDLVNSCKGMFVCPQQFWQATDFPPYQNATYIAADQNEILWVDLQLPCTTSAATAQRLGKIQVLRARAGTISLTLNCKLTALPIQCGDNIYLNYTRMGWVNQMFEVTGFVFASYSDSDGKPTVGINLTLRGTAAGVWDWTAGSDTPLPQGPASILPSPFVVPAPTSLSISNSVQTSPDGIIVPAMKLSYTPSTDTQVQSGGFTQVQYRNHSVSPWDDWQDALGNATAILVTDVVAGQSYDFRIRAVNPLGRPSLYLEVDNTLCTGAGAAAGVPTTVIATAGQGQLIGVIWDLQSDPTIKYYKIYRSTNSSDPSPTFLEQVYSNQFKDTSVALGTTYFYWVSSVNRSNFESSRSTVSNGATATQTSLINPNPPATPSAPSLSGSGSIYTVGDGSVYATQDFSVAALPANTLTAGGWQQLEYQKSGTTNWVLAAYLTNSSTQTVTVPDLSPNVGYIARVIAYNEDGVDSTPSSSTSFTSANKSSPSTGLSGFTGYSPATSAYAVPPLIINGFQQYITIVTFTPSPSLDIDHCEVGTWSANSGTFGGVNLGSFNNNDPYFLAYQATITTTYIWTRVKNTSGVYSAWVYTGVQMTANMGFGGGTLVTQDASAVAITGGTSRTASERTAALIVAPSGAGSPTTRNVVYSAFVPVVLAGSGTNQESFSISLAGRGFSAAPTHGWAANWDPNFQIIYDVQNAGNSASTAWFIIINLTTAYGGTIPATTTGMMFALFQ